jgi:hypothetical protein
MLAWLILSACTSSNDPLTCDALQKCGDGISINALLCPSRLDDPACGQAFREWLQCYSDHCSTDVDANIGLCEAQIRKWQECPKTHVADAAAE